MFENYGLSALAGKYFFGQLHPHVLSRIRVFVSVDSTDVFFFLSLVSKLRGVSRQSIFTFKASVWRLADKVLPIKC